LWGNKCRGYLPKTRFHALEIGFRVEVLRFSIFGLCLKFAFCMFPSLFIIFFCLVVITFAFATFILKFLSMCRQNYECDLLAIKAFEDKSISFNEHGKSRAFSITSRYMWLWSFPFQHSFLFAFWTRMHIGCLFWKKTCEITKRDLCVNHHVCVFAFCTIASTLRELYESCKGGEGQQFLELVVTLNKWQCF